MEEWLVNGCQLGWLIDLQEETVYIYRKDGSRETLKGFQNKVPGEDVLPAFELDLTELKVG